jgi:hypothetical protein
MFLFFTPTLPLQEKIMLIGWLIKMGGHAPVLLDLVWLGKEVLLFKVPLHPFCADFW